MTIRIIVLIIAGIVFLLLGIVVSRFHKWKKPIVFLPILFGISLVCLALFGPPSQSKAKVDAVKGINDDSVSYITITPTQTHKGIGTISRTIKIYNKDTITLFCKTLHKATPEGDGFLKNPSYACVMELHLKDSTIIPIGIKKAGKTTCLTIDSNGESGWHYANLKANELGVLLNTIK